MRNVLPKIAGCGVDVANPARLGAPGVGLEVQNALAEFSRRFLGMAVDGVPRFQRRLQLRRVDLAHFRELEVLDPRFIPAGTDNSPSVNAPEVGPRSDIGLRGSLFGR